MSLELFQSRTFEFASPSAISHTITHNLGISNPDVVVYINLNEVIPSSILVLNANQVQITFFAPRAITGSVQ